MIAYFPAYAPGFLLCEAGESREEGVHSECRDMSKGAPHVMGNNESPKGSNISARRKMKREMQLMKKSSKLK